MKNKFLVVFTTTVIVILSCVLIFFIRANRPMSRAREEAIELAQAHTDLTDVTDFYWFTRQETYFTLVGTDSKEQEMLVIIPQSGEKLTVMKPSEGLSEEEVLAKVMTDDQAVEIVKVTLGMVDQQPTWEVVAKTTSDDLNYYLVDFKTGEIFDSIKNM